MYNKESKLSEVQYIKYIYRLLNLRRVVKELPVDTYQVRIPSRFVFKRKRITLGASTPKFFNANVKGPFNLPALFLSGNAYTLGNNTHYFGWPVSFTQVLATSPIF